MKIETKYDIGESVWFLEDYRLQSSKISGVEYQKLGDAKPYILYRFLAFQPKKESQVFKTKEDLIKYLSR